MKNCLISQKDIKQELTAMMKYFVNYGKPGVNEQAEKLQDSSNLTHKDKSNTRKSSPHEVVHSQKNCRKWMIEH